MAVIEPRRLVAGDRVLTLRSATEADAAEVQRVFFVTYSETEFLSRYPDELQDKHDVLVSWLANKCVSPSELFLVAEHEGRLVALAGLTGSKLRRFSHGAELALAVMKDYWGLGIGRHLVQALVDWADASGLVRIYLEVVDTNTRAIRLYERFGFEVEGRLRARRKHGEVFADNLTMARLRVPSPTVEV